jgi:inositol oxygenase
MDFRNYDDCTSNVKELYKNQRINQNLEFVKKSIQKYCSFTRKDKFIDLFEKISLKDLSDPDLDCENYYHFYQTAEKIRKDGNPEWMQLVGLIHDFGKILYLKGCTKDGTCENSQWGIVGDTFIVGCKIPETIVFPEFNKLNKDNFDELGIYKQGIGLNNVYCSFGHDEYLYQLLKFNKVNLPTEAYYMIRFHSLYLWHDKNEYNFLENEMDKKYKSYVKLFNKYDLYTKDKNKKNIDNLKLYYRKLIKKFIPEYIYW